MKSTASIPPSVWVGRVLSGLFVLFMLLVSASAKLFFPDVAGAYTSLDQLGWPRKFLLLLGGLEVLVTVLYVIPPTRVLGAVLATGLLGGAIAAQLRVENALFSNILFGLYMGIIMWAGLWLRDPLVRALLPLRRDATLR
jgi:hypothetical protein